MGTMTVSPTGGAASTYTAPIVKSVTPTSNQTLAFDNASYDQTYDLSPTGLLSLLNVTLPSDASSIPGQTVAIFSTQTITTLTISGATTIRNLVGTMAGGTKVFLRKVRANTWDIWLA